ncbi:MAG: riboflavin synthase subunit alpha [Bdellovibrionales bacterium RBG_16_40_8]|nr:MAG: riboflavin synthase subunit alpha [Bdellovibrionales bacterium RBG_16_40_8]
MFSGIVEAKTELIEYTPDDPRAPKQIQIKIKKPLNFNDISRGDSIAINGVCMTVEVVAADSLQFVVGAETLKITKWSENELKSKELNIERSLKFSDRIHGHLVSGHVDGMATITECHSISGSQLIKVKIPEELLHYVWKKGSITLNGVSLTINEVSGSEIEVCLIPETLRSTNLGKLHVGDRLTVESDQLARAFRRQYELERSARELHT